MSRHAPRGRGGRCHVALKVAVGGQQNAEFVAAEPVGRALVGDRHFELAAEPGQERIARDVAEGVVV